MRDLLVWGAGGHARVVADIVRCANEFQIVGFIDDVNLERAGDSFCNTIILGGRDALLEQWARGVKHIVIAIGDCAMRMSCANDARGMGFTLATAIHPSAIVAQDVRIGAGTALAAGTIVNPAVILGENVIVNTAASIDHDCVIDDGAHIAPGARLGGGVRVGRGAWIGIGAVVRDHVSIGSETIVGAGAVVLDNIPARVVAYGVPARVVRKLE